MHSRNAFGFGRTRKIRQVQQGTFAQFPVASPNLFVFHDFCDLDDQADPVIYGTRGTGRSVFVFAKCHAVDPGKFMLTYLRRCGFNM